VGTFYEEDAMLARFLALSSPTMLTQARVDAVPFERIAAQLNVLSRGERKLAQQAACNLLSAAELKLPVSRRSLAYLMVRSSPRHAPAFLFRLATARFRRAIG
jgi:hypothetical protein